MGDRGNIQFIYDFPRDGDPDIKAARAALSDAMGALDDGHGDRNPSIQAMAKADDILARLEKRFIFFYTHWGGSELPETLAAALDRGRGRWNDEAYLARIIFSEMVQDEILKDTGYGIAPYEPDNEHPILVVDAKAMTADGKPFEEFITAVKSGAYGGF